MTRVDSPFPDSVFPLNRDPDIIEIGIGEIGMGQAPKRLLTPALGSCVAVALHDPFMRRGCLAHVMLPNAPENGGAQFEPGRFADTAIVAMIEMLRREGTLKRRLQAKIAGGAAMFRGETAIAGIGGRNVSEVKRQLALMSIPLLAEDTGEAHARTVEFFLETGEVLVRSYQFGIIRL
ncbi:MAG: chemotaxis protein CheD [Coriobacteriia bacterium]|nr:chemotaxis protein CheD [Coriobacteriia bacterium]